MRILAVLAAVLLLAPACGHKKPTFRNGDYQTVIDHPAKYAGAHVDVVGQVASVARDEKGAPWLLVYIDAKHASQATIVEVPPGGNAPAERQLVHVVGTVVKGAEVPFDLGGYESAPVVLADNVSPVAD
jgi:hypothetical protein